MKTSELTGAALDWAVAKCEGIELENGCYNRLLVDGRMSKGQSMLVPFTPSTHWEQGGAIIEREWINIVKNESGKYWQAASEKWMLNDGHPCIGETPLIAAMRCYVESELGDDVEVPEELQGETA
jgi:hypothetical protein